MPEFSAWFAADQPVEEVPFTLKGHECAVFLRGMDQTKKDCFEMMTARLVNQVQGGGEIQLDAADKLKRFLVSNTLVNWRIRREAKTPGGETEIINEELPQKLAERETILRNFSAAADAWEWLVSECKRVNGYRDEDEKNS